MIKPKSSNDNLAALELFWKGQGESPKLSDYEKVAQLCVRALKNLIGSPLSTIVSTFTISISLLFVVLFLIIIENVRGGIVGSTDLKMSIFLEDDITDLQKGVILDGLKKMTGVKQIEHVSKAQALENFKGALGKDSYLLSGLHQDNPIPASFTVLFTAGQIGTELLGKYRLEIEQQKGVQDVVYNAGYLEQFSAIFVLFKQLSLAGIFVVLLLSSFIIANTIKLAIFSERQEITIMELVGATDSFIRAPYLIGGGIQGILGAIISIILGWGIFSSLIGIASRHGVLEGYISSLRFLSPSWSILVCLLGLGVGICGNFLAVRSFSQEF